MTNYKHPAYRYADELRDHILARTGIKSTNLECPRENSAMTPCVARDGHLAVAYQWGEPAICVGCGADVRSLLDEELSK